jgi:hypothetical protein
MLAYKTTSDINSLDIDTSAYSYGLQSNEIIFQNDINFIDDNNNNNSLMNVNSNYDQYYQTPYEFNINHQDAYYYTHTSSMEHHNYATSNTYPILYPFKQCLLQNGYSFDTQENGLQVMYDDVKIESPSTIETDTSNYMPRMLKQEPSNFYQNHSLLANKKSLKRKFKDLTEVSFFNKNFFS